MTTRHSSFSLTGMIGFVLAVSLNFALAEQSFKFVFVPRCQGKGPCAAALIEAKWKKLAECTDGHEWHYVLEKDKEKRQCFGINALGGPSETPCRPFKGSVQDFAKCPMLKKSQKN